MSDCEYCDRGDFHPVRRVGTYSVIECRNISPGIAYHLDPEILNPLVDARVEKMLGCDKVDKEDE